MKLALSRVVMAIAVRSFSESRHDWAMAMEVEFEVAVEAGEGLAFAVGCLMGAWREMPAYEEGRFTLASYLFSLGVIVPMAALLLLSVAHGFAYLAPDGTGTAGLLGSQGPVFPVTYANQTGLPLMAVLTLGLGFGHFAMAWAILDRNWARVAVMGRVGAAVMATMIIFTGILFLYDTCAFPQAGAIAIELLAIWILMRWHDELPVSVGQNIQAQDDGW